MSTGVTFLPEHAACVPSTGGSGRGSGAATYDGTRRPSRGNSRGGRLRGTRTGPDAQRARRSGLVVVMLWCGSGFADLLDHGDPDRSQDENDEQLLHGFPLVDNGRGDRLHRTWWNRAEQSTAARPRVLDRSAEVNGVWWPPSSSKRVGRVLPVRWVRFLPPPPITHLQPGPRRALTRSSRNRTPASKRRNQRVRQARRGRSAADEASADASAASDEDSEEVVRRPRCAEASVRRRAGRGRRCRPTGGAACSSPGPRSGGCAPG